MLHVKTLEILANYQLITSKIMHFIKYHKVEAYIKQRSN